MNTEKQKITMTDKYKYRNGGPARVICVDNNYDEYPIITLDKRGNICHHLIDGSIYEGEENENDLIPDTPIWEGELWVHTEKSACCVLEKDDEKQWNEMGYRKIKAQEVTGE